MSERACHCDAVHTDLGQRLVVVIVVANVIMVVVVVVVASGVVSFANHRCVRKSLSL